ncbi:MAG: phytoene desaturase [Bacteroidetes bacterium]|nr:phytoene desaturase [Bacteroidota bacterium]
MAKAILIGAGVGGLATAIRLAKKGYTVEVFEANNYIGGKLSTFTLGDYRFDAGPSLFTMPKFVEELFTLCGENASDSFQYKRKDIACTYFWEDGKTLTAYGDTKRFVEEVEEKLAVPAKTLNRYLSKAKKKFDRTQPLFLERSLHKWQTFLRKETLVGIAKYFSFEIDTSLNSVNQAHLQEPHLVQFYNRFATYNGSNPYQTPGMMTLVQHLEQHYGTYIPKKGMGDISASLYELAKRQGVIFHLSASVDKIIVENKKAVGIQVNETEHHADIVVSNMDVVPTYRKLLTHQKQPEKILSQERSSSAVIFYWGMGKSFPQLDLHNIFFSDDYKAEFDAIFKTKTLFEDPTVYVNITSKDVPADAPKGKENWFVMINAPHDTGQDWEELAQELRQWVMNKLNRILDTDIAPLIEEEWIMTPNIIEARTQSYLGALYGASSNNKMAAFLRHPNFSREISNLYFCGGSVHPGGGIPLCLLSAKIVADLTPTP